ncbi:hypothetical protein OIU76_022828 [Salix suchowensis]|nr:hypothetical protein OIU76_022828 [Salix suchowensis]KAJ6373572.1 hypothetical protein OIU78_029284 [Salix suchowensis]
MADPSNIKVYSSSCLKKVGPGRKGSDSSYATGREYPASFIRLLSTCKMAFFFPPYSSLLFSTYSMASAATSFTKSNLLSSDSNNLWISIVNNFPPSLIFLTCSSRKGTRSSLYRKRSSSLV